MKQTIDVAAGIWKRDGNYFLARRKGGTLDGCWEFPGGKREEGESFEEALIREWKEELNCIPLSPRFFAGTLTKINSNQRIRMQTFIFSGISGKPVLSDHSETGWFSGEDLKTLKLAPADVDVISLLIRKE